MHGGPKQIVYTIEPLLDNCSRPNGNTKPTFVRATRICRGLLPIT